MNSCKRYYHCYSLLSYIIFRSSFCCNAFFTSLNFNFIHQPYQPHCNFALQSTSQTPTIANNYNSNNQRSMWDPITQTYKDGIVPSHHTAIDIDELLTLNNGKLKIFGYGSLCWHPGYDGVLSLASITQDGEEDDDIDQDGGSGSSSASSSPSNDKNKGEDTQQQNRRRKVTTKAGRAIGYQRCWSQRSADHRGTTSFNGIVCTLLSDDEVDTLHRHNDNNDVGTSDKKEDTKSSKRREHPSMTEGLIYTVDVDLVDDCLAELDFREKGVSIVCIPAYRLCIDNSTFVCSYDVF